jgi:hypothetical protein
MNLAVAAGFTDMTDPISSATQTTTGVHTR